MPQLDAAIAFVVRHDRIGPLCQQALLGQLVQKGCRPEILVVRRHGLRAGRLEVDQDDVAALLGSGGGQEARG
ncbi:MAG: hypothetical protein M3R38_31870 [Actinomycetota bacterium]|jgi:hypothetical protein|nr:hypothetical protein [Actinomycetota bacterium]